MVVLLVDGWAHAPASRPPSASQVPFRSDVRVIEDNARAADIFDPVMIHDVYHHEP
jgi:hypothetical protein